MLKRLCLGGVIGGFLLGGAAMAKEEGSSEPARLASPLDRLSPNDLSYLETLVRNNLMDVAFGLMALQKGEHGEVQRHGKTLIRAALLSNEEIMMLLRKKGESFTIPEIRAPAEVMAELNKKKGKEFDAAYLSALVRKALVDRQDVESFLTKNSDPEVKKLAARDASMREALLSLAARLGQAAGVKDLPPVGAKEEPKATPSPRSKIPAMPDIPYGM